MSAMLALSLLAVAVTAPPPDAADEADIVVLGQRLQGASVIVSRNDRGRFQCGLSRSTGLAKLDEALCRTATACVRKGAGTADAVNACVTARKPALLDEVRAFLKARRS